MYGLLGRKLSHSLSPEIHSYFGGYGYELFCREPDDIDGLFADSGVTAFNVTIPYKIEAFGRCDILSETAWEIGSVNTIVKKDGKIYGYNTDLYGFEAMVKRAGADFAGKKILILGSGGASRTVSVYCKRAGAAKAVIISRSGENNYGNLCLHRDADIIVNTTPVGMYPENGSSPVDLGLFTRLGFVFDLIYNPFRTKLLLDAGRLGIPSSNGLYMLAAQGFRSSELFTGKELDASLIDRAYEGLRKRMLNIILTGMPGCGKSTAGKELAELTGREFADTDAEIEKAAGRTIPEIFESEGESGFRDAESKAVARISKKTGLIIATGGGAVLREENRDSLRQNGIIIYLRRSVDELSGEGRPLSSSREKIQKLYEERRAVYESFADYTVDVSEDIGTTAKRILECVSL